jgi:hypothetical protein
MRMCDSAANRPLLRPSGTRLLGPSHSFQKRLFSNRTLSILCMRFRCARVEHQEARFNFCERG